MLVRLALYQPDIPQNAGSLIRLGACLGVPVDIIEPCGFLFTDRALKRVGMDYLDKAQVCRHSSLGGLSGGAPGARWKAHSLDVERHASLHPV